MTRLPLEALLEVLPFGAVGFDDDGRILALNARAVRRLGVDLAPGADLFAACAELPGFRAAAMRFGGDSSGLDAAWSFRTRGRDGRPVRCELHPLHANAERAGFLIVDEAGDAIEADDPLLDARHEMSNAVMALLGHAELLRERTARDPEATERLDRLVAEGERIHDRLRAIADASRDG